MASDAVKQEVERAKDCCNKIEQADSPEGIRRQVSELRSCCDNIEQNL